MMLDAGTQWASPTVEDTRTALQLLKVDCANIFRKMKTTFALP